MTVFRTYSVGLIIILGILLISCSQKSVSFDETETKHISNARLTYTYIDKLPPGVLKINDTLYCDRTEITNISWREYQWVIKDVFGLDSKEYKSTIPDTLGYLELYASSDSTYSSIISKSTYFSNIIYNDYPLIGITLDQAKQFSKWRSNRVFEMYMGNSGLIEFKRYTSQKKYFTIDRFLKSDIFKKHHTRISHYPHYFIPDSHHYKIVFDKLLNKEIETRSIQALKQAIIYQNEFEVPFRPVPIGENYKNGLYDILGNVAEIIDCDNKTMGGSYLQNMKEIKNLKVREELIPSQHIGFRNFFIWKKTVTP